ncbi:hypothetical protein D3C84_1265470 [compost metagenome]
MVRATHRRKLLAVRDHRVRRRPHDDAQHEHREHPFDVGHEALGARNALHPDP